jgi:hypothetical protein
MTSAVQFVPHPAPRADAAVELLVSAFRVDPTLDWVFLGGDTGYDARRLGYFREGSRTPLSATGCV